MKFELRRASNKFENNPPKTVEINTIEDLMALVTEYDCSLIVDHDGILVYDDYVE